MSRRLGVVCAGVLLLAAGCVFDSFRISFTGPATQQQVVAGSIGRVSVSLQEALAEAGIAVLAKRQGEEVVLTGSSRSGKVFQLFLRREPAEGKEKTRITVKWDREADREFWLTIVQPLASAPAGDNPSDADEQSDRSLSNGK